jgi:hypothetical protein
VHVQLNIEEPRKKNLILVATSAQSTCILTSFILLVAAELALFIIAHDAFVQNITTSSVQLARPFPGA